MSKDVSTFSTSDTKTLLGHTRPSSVYRSFFVLSTVPSPTPRPYRSFSLCRI